MVDMKDVKKFDVMSRKNQELRIEDRDSVAHQMRQNLASDIMAGYGVSQVCHQIVDIEDYEDTTRYCRSHMKEAK